MSTNLRYVALYKNSTSTLVDKHCNENGKDVSFFHHIKKNFIFAMIFFLSQYIKNRIAIKMKPTKFSSMSKILIYNQKKDKKCQQTMDHGIAKPMIKTFFTWVIIKIKLQTLFIKNFELVLS